MSLLGSRYLSHPPLHHPVLSGNRDLPESTVYYVDPVRGKDHHPGTEDMPWQSLQRSLEKLVPGDTLLLRGGVYYENVYCSITGTPEKPITICGYPGETVILDAGMPEFQLSPELAWEPGEAEGEYVSIGTYRNIRDVLGLFADSNIGLQTYWRYEYLIAENELHGTDPNTGEQIPYYCGPGIYYNKSTGKIHIRLAHTRLKDFEVANYEGETDPRRISLVISAFRSSPLYLDQAMHLRFQDLILRGGGYNSLVMNFAVDVQFEYVTIFGGTYCIRSKNSGPVRMTHCGVYGQIPPWGYRTENSLYLADPAYYDPFTSPPEGQEERNIARLPTHALLVTEGGEESDVFCFPHNNHWEISYCEFADSHDGLYFNGRHMRLHHCWIHDLQDDVIYISNPTPTRVCDDIHIHHNYLSHCMLAFGAHRRGCAHGKIYIYGNLIDMREPVRFTRPTLENPEGFMQYPNPIRCVLLLAHGRTELLGMENVGFYHNTAIISDRAFAGNITNYSFPASRREVYNNVFVYYNGLPSAEDFPLLNRQNDASQAGDFANLNGRVDMEGNLHWSPWVGEREGKAWLEQICQSPIARQNVEEWQGNHWERVSRYADPRFRKWELLERTESDFCLGEESPARGAAVDFPDREQLSGLEQALHVGAFQGEGPLLVGICRRIRMGRPSVGKG